MLLRGFVRCVYILLVVLLAPAGVFLCIALVASATDVAGVIFIFVLFFRTVVVGFFFVFEEVHRKIRRKAEQHRQNDTEKNIEVELGGDLW